MAKLKQVIPFNSPFISGQELLNFKKVLKNKKFSGRGSFTKKCEDTLTKKFDRYSLLTTSCTHALEIIAFLLNIKKGDEIIVPSFTFVSTANAFAIRGAKIVFADSKIDSPCIDSTSIKKKITKKTKAICIVHYAGIACDMKKISEAIEKQMYQEKKSILATSKSLFNKAVQGNERRTKLHIVGKKN